MEWGGWRAHPSLPVFALVLGCVIVAAVLAWTIVRALWRMPHRHRARAGASGGSRAAAMPSPTACWRSGMAMPPPRARMPTWRGATPPTIRWRYCCMRNRPSSTATATAPTAPSAPWPSARTPGCSACAGCSSKRSAPTIPAAAVMIAEEALKIAPASTWASQAVLGFRCAEGDWTGALAILENNLASGLIDKTAYRRQRGVLLTARALELESVDRDLARDSAMEAVKLAPTLVPAAVLASKYQSEAHQIRRSMRIVEAAWLANPHPDLADAYAHVRLGDSARQRLVRVETLAAKTPGHVEGALAVARAAIDASEFARAREVLAPLLAAPTQRVAMLMAEIERTEHGDSGRARAWTLRAVRALHDPVWTADGYVSDRWRPVSPVTGRLDAFQWQTPLAALPSDKGVAIEASPFDEAMLAPRRVAPPPAEPPAGDRGDGAGRAGQFAIRRHGRRRPLPRRPSRRRRLPRRSNRHGRRGAAVPARVDLARGPRASSMPRSCSDRPGAR